MTNHPKIVLHLGPEKCGSTTLQAAMAPDGPLADRVLAPVLDPYAVIALEQDPVDESIMAHFRNQITQAMAQAQGRVLVLSHEMAFKSLPILKNLADLACAFSRDVRAIAYVRRQSDLIVSGFGQWHFRSRARLDEAADVMRAHGVDPDLFRALERHLIAVILGGWSVARQPSGHVYFNWSQSVPERSKVLERFGIPLLVGALPGRRQAQALVPDFVQRLGLPGPEVTMAPLRNPSYHPYLIEAAATAIQAGADLPGPHDGNDFYGQAAAVIADAPGHTAFVTLLKSHIDSCFAASNCQFAMAQDLPQARFPPAMTVSRSRILAEIQDQARRRSALDPDQRAQEAGLREVMAKLLWQKAQKRH